MRHGLRAVLALAAVACAAPPAVRVEGIVDVRDEDVLSRPLPELAFEPGEWERELPADERARFDDVLRAGQAQSKVHAVSAAVHVLGRGGWRGIRTAGGTPELALGSRFHAGSIGKALTAALVLQLVGEQRFELATTIDRWFPGVPNAKSITVEHLLAHTSGLLDADVERDGGSAPYRTAEQVLVAVEHGEPLFLPGQKWSYCNAGYQLLGLVVAREREQPYEQALHRLLDTVGLRESAVVTRENQRELLVASWHGGRSGFDAIDYAVPLGAGLLASTPRDLIRWHATLLAGKVLPRERTAVMLERLYPMSRGSLWWGRGLMLLCMPEPVGETVWSAGRIKGFGAELAWIPGKRAFVAVMVNDDTQTGPFLWRLANAL